MRMLTLGNIQVAILEFLKFSNTCCHGNEIYIHDFTKMSPRWRYLKKKEVKGYMEWGIWVTVIKKKWYFPPTRHIGIIIIIKKEDTLSYCHCGVVNWHCAFGCHLKGTPSGTFKLFLHVAHFGIMRWWNNTRACSSTGTLNQALCHLLSSSEFVFFFYIYMLIRHLDVYYDFNNTHEYH